MRLQTAHPNRNNRSIPALTAQPDRAPPRTDGQSVSRSTQPNFANKSNTPRRLRLAARLLAALIEQQQPNEVWLELPAVRLCVCACVPPFHRLCLFTCVQPSSALSPRQLTASPAVSFLLSSCLSFGQRRWDACSLPASIHHRRGARRKHALCIVHHAPRRENEQRTNERTHLNQTTDGL